MADQPPRRCRRPRTRPSAPPYPPTPTHPCIPTYVDRYRWSGRSFGFSSHPDLWLWAADAGIKQRGSEERPDDRLSWNLDTRSTGGWRAGRVIDLGGSREWEKRLYYRM